MSEDDLGTLQLTVARSQPNRVPVAYPSQMSAMGLVQACIGSGLRRGEVTEVHLAVQRDRLAFRLTFAAAPTAGQTAAMVRSISGYLTPDDLTMATPHGTWRWRGAAPTFDASVVTDGIVRFEAKLLQRAEDSLRTVAFESCLAHFRVWLQSRIEPEPGATGYSTADIEILDGLSVVRNRPRMYVGSVTSAQVLVEPILLSAGWTWLGGGATRIDVTLENETLVVKDNGFPYSFEIDPEVGRSEVEWTLLSLHGRRRLRGQRRASHETAGELGDLSIVNALSATLQLESSRSGVCHRQRFAVGKLVSGPEPRPQWPADGNELRVTSDLNMFEVGFDPIATRDAVLSLAERAPGLETSFNGERFHVDSLLPAATRATTHPPLGGKYLDFVISGSGWRVRCAFGVSAGEGKLVGFTNLAPTGGSHIRGVLLALGAATAPAEERLMPTADDLVGAVSLEAAEPDFDVVERGRPGERWEAVMPEVEARVGAELERPLAVFLDDVASARERLFERWRERSAAKREPSERA